MIDPELHRPILIAADMGTGAVVIQRGAVLALSYRELVRRLTDAGASVSTLRHADWLYYEQGGTVLAILDGPVRVMRVGRAGDPWAVAAREDGITGQLPSYESLEAT